jgi:hypothetical protein
VCEDALDIVKFVRRLSTLADQQPGRACSTKRADYGAGVPGFCRSWTDPELGGGGVGAAVGLANPEEDAGGDEDDADDLGVG